MLNTTHHPFLIKALQAILEKQIRDCILKIINVTPMVDEDEQYYEVEFEDELKNNRTETVDIHSILEHLLSK